MAGSTGTGPRTRWEGTLCRAAKGVHLKPLTVRLLLLVLFGGGNLLFRGMYVFWIGRSLRRAKARRNVTGDFRARWMAFKRKASLVLYGDTITFAAVTLTTFRTLDLHIPEGWMIAGGGLLTLIGLVVRLSAVRVVGTRGYYWYNFFCPDRELHYSPTGIYRLLKNPMYGLGYLHVVGIPLIFRSLGGLVLGVVDWILVWVFYFLVERSHTHHAVVEYGSETIPGAPKPGLLVARNRRRPEGREESVIARRGD